MAIVTLRIGVHLENVGSSKWRNENGNGGAGVDRSILDKLVAEVRQFHNRDFLKAAMAVCALSAVADDEVKLSEHYRVDHVLAMEPALMVLDTEKAIDTLYAYIYALRTDGPSATKVLDKKVRRMAGNRKRARTLMRVAYLVITADDEIHEKEREEFGRLCHLLDLEPRQVWPELAS
jgi:tellurite resistance protein TerB